MASAGAEWPHHGITRYRFANHSARTRCYRDIRYDNAHEELHDHPEDPHEWRDLASSPEHADLMVRSESLLPTVHVEPITSSWR